jgi:hypothetical protein
MHQPLIELTSSCEYGCCGSSRIWSVRPASTTRPFLHHQRALAQQPHHAQIVRNHDHGHPGRALQLLHQVQHTRLNGHVETTRHLIQQHDGGAIGECLGHLHALLHAATEMRWNVVHARQRDLHPAQQMAGAIANRIDPPPLGRE